MIFITIFFLEQTGKSMPDNYIFDSFGVNGWSSKVFKWRIMTFPESFKNVKINIWLKNMYIFLVSIAKNTFLDTHVKI